MGKSILASISSTVPLRLLNDRRRTIAKLQIQRFKVRLNQVTASSLPPPSCSIWCHIYDTRIDANFLMFAGIPYRTFSQLLRRFSCLYNTRPVNPGNTGRPKVILAHQALAVVLMFYSSTCDTKYLGLIHNLTPRRITDIIARCEPMLQTVLRQYPDAKIVWPSLDSQREAGRIVEAQFPLVPGRFGFVDGKNLSVLHSGNVEKQNAQYNGWLHACFVTGILVFDTTGLLIYAKHNCPGSWNDGDMCVDLCYKLLDRTKTLAMHGLCADTAFPVGDALKAHIVSPLKEGVLHSNSVILLTIVQASSKT
jgi:hypothetical protein